MKKSATIRSMVTLPLELPGGGVSSGKIVSFSGLHDRLEHFALMLGSPDPLCPLVRVHSECVTGDVLRSIRCDCGPQLNEAIQCLHDAGGYLLYLRQEGRGIGLYQKLAAYRLQDDGHDTFEANRLLGFRDDEREYGSAAAMLVALSVSRIRLLSNNPDKQAQLEAAGIIVAERIPTGVFVAEHNRRYLEAKVRVAHHTMSMDNPEVIR